MSNQQKLTSLLDAAKQFAHESYDQSTMRSIIINMVRHQEATKILLKELELLTKDLR